VAARRQHAIGPDEEAVGGEVLGGVVEAGRARVVDAQQQRHPRLATLLAVAPATGGIFQQRPVKIDRVPACADLPLLLDKVRPRP
jgi:hypothetical protein